MNMSLWCPTNVRLWLWAAICKTALQLHSTYCWYDLWRGRRRQGIVTVQTVVIKLREMSWAGFNNKLIAVRFRRQSRTPPRDQKRARQELKIGPSTQPSCTDGLILLSSNDFEYSEHSAGLRAQQVVGPLISARRCRWNLNHGVTSGSWNHNMNSESQLWSGCHFVFGSLARMMYWKTDNEQTTFCCCPYGSVRARLHANNVCIKAYIAYFSPYIRSFSRCRIICEDVLMHCIIQAGVSGAQCALIWGFSTQVLAWREICASAHCGGDLHVHYNKPTRSNVSL